MGILDGLFGGGGGDPLDLYGDLFTDKQKAALRDREMGQGLLRMAGAFAKAAQPTLLPGGGIGSAIGSAAAAMGAGQDEATERILKGMQTSEAVRASQQKRALNAKISPILLRMLEQQNGLPSGSLAPAAAAAPATPASPDTPIAATPPEAGPAGLPSRFGLGPQPDRSQYGFPVPPTAAGPMPPAPAGGRITPADYGVPDAPGAGAGLLSPPDELVAQSAPEEGLLARMQRMAAMQQGGGGGSGLPFQLASAAIPGAGGDDAVGSGGAAADYGVNYLQKELGLAPHQARGAVRWMENVESGLKPDIVNPTSGAYGIAQHLGPRKQALMQKYGGSPSLEQQFSFIADELRGPEAAALRSLQNTKTENEAFRAWGRNFERPSAAEYARATGEGFSGGGAAPASGGGAAPGPGAGAAPSSGVIPGLGMTPQGLAALNALTEMGGLGEPFKSLLETYYKSPGYLSEKTSAETKARTDIEDPINQRMKVLETALQMRKDGILYNPQTGEIKADPEWDKIHGRRAEDTKILELDYAKKLKTFEEQQKIAEEIRKDQKEISPQPIYRGGVIVEQPMTREAAVARLKEQSMRPGEYRDGDIVAKPIGNLSPDHQYKMSPTGGLTVEPITGTPAAETAQERERKKSASDLSLQISRDIVVQNADRVEALVKDATLPVTGAVGSLLSRLGGTAANDVRAMVETLKARSSLDALNAMRQASPTGAALGNVSNAEGDRLAAALSNLDQSQSQDQFLYNLRRAKQYYIDAIHGPGAHAKLSDAPALKVPEAPRTAVAPAQAPAARAEAAAAIAKGAPREAVIKRLQEMGVDAGGL